MSLQTIQFLIGAISLMIAYIISTMLIGRAEAEVATYAGDDTPAEAGFRSWDPFVFTDIPGFLCVLILGMGWGKQIPFNPHHVTGNHKLRTVFLVYMSQPLFSILLAFIAMLACTFLLGPESLKFTFSGLSESIHGLPFQQLSQAYPDASPRLLVCATMLLCIITFTMFNSVWTMINNGFHYLLFIGHEHGHDYMKHSEALAFFGPLVVLILFNGLLRFVMLKYLAIAATFIAHLFGV